MVEETLDLNLTYSDKCNKFNIQNNIIYELSIETTKLLNKEQDKLKNIKWTDGESNIDTEYSKLSCECCIKAWDIIKVKYPNYNEIFINCEIPDINITFVFLDGRKEKHKIELKSSKNIKMPGSTIKKLNINQPLIYCLRPNTKTKLYKIRCSQYHTAMGENNIELFQDRTPRPSINFEKMNDINRIIPFENKNKQSWIDHYAKCAFNRINEKTLCQKSWQDDMVKKIIEEYIKNTSIEKFQLDKMILQVENISI